MNVLEFWSHCTQSNKGRVGCFDFDQWASIGMLSPQSICEKSVFKPNPRLALIRRQRVAHSLKLSSIGTNSSSSCLLVHGIAFDPDVDHSYHPHRQNPPVQSRASAALIATTILICAVGVLLPHTWFGEKLGFTLLPNSYWTILAAMLFTYAALTHLAKSWFIRRWGREPRLRR